LVIRQVKALKDMLLYYMIDASIKICAI